MNDELKLEQEIKEKGLNAPRITPTLIDEVIVSEQYFTAANGVAGAGGVVSSDDDALRMLTFCVLILSNGFTVVGESACASPENFDAEIGRKIARENARNKIWSLEGYLLRSVLSGEVHRVPLVGDTVDEASGD